MRKLRAVTTGDVVAIEEACRLVAAAIRQLRLAGAARAAAYVRRAAKSVEGARRHAMRCELRAETGP